MSYAYWSAAYARDAVAYTTNVMWGAWKVEDLDHLLASCVTHTARHAHEWTVGL